MKSPRSTFLSSILVAAAAGVFSPVAAQAGQLFEVLGPSLRTSASSAHSQLHPIAVDRAALADADLVLPLPGRAPMTARLEKVERRGAENFTWRGFTAEGPHPGRVVLTWVRGYLAGMIYAGDEAYEILTLREGGQAIARLEPGRFAPCGGALDPEPQKLGVEVTSPAPGSRITEDPPNDIDLLGFYTAQARDAAGGVTQIEATVQAAVDMANTAFIDSEMLARFDLVATALSSRADSGNMSADLNWLAGDAATAALRDEVGADMVSLLVESGSACGVGFVMRNPGAGFASSAFQVTARSCAVGNLSFAHEHGHNMGFEHDPANGTTPANASFPYSFGHFVNGSYRTVMSYSTQCSSGCTRVAHFSNPDILHNGVATGIADQRDNARSGDATAPIVAKFRAAIVVSQIFADGFESGTAGAWSSVSP